MRYAVLAAVMAVGLVAIGWTAVAQADSTKVDCKTLDFAFEQAATADWVECYRERQSEPPSGGGAEGASAVYEDMLADEGKHVVRISTGQAGAHTYFDKGSVRQSIRGFDELVDISDWSNEPHYQRYQVARFHAKLWQTPVDCVAFAKYGGGRISQLGYSIGASSYSVGYDCWRDGAPDRAKIEATIGAIK